MQVCIYRNPYDDDKEDDRDRFEAQESSVRNRKFPRLMMMPTSGH